MAGKQLSVMSRVSRRVLVRGESLVAAAGLACAAILVTALGACAWWTLHSYAATSDEAREERVRAVADLVARSTEGLLANHDVSAVRRLVADAATAQEFDRCRVVLSGPGGVEGMLVADGQPGEGGRAPYAELPARWEPEGVAAADVSALETAVRRPDGVLEVRVPLAVPGRGGARLEIDDGRRLTMAETWPLKAGIGAIAVSALAAMWMGYRAMRGRVRALGAIGEALRGAGNAEAGEGELMVSEGLGVEAAAWNTLVADRQRLRELMAGGKVAEKLASRRGRDGDLGGVCDGLWVGLLLVDEQMRVKYANGAATVFLRVKREELVGSELRKTLDDAKVTEAINGVISGTLRNRAIVEVKRQGEKQGAAGGEQGGSVLRVTVRPLRKEDTATALVAIEDVTQQRVADEARNGFVAQATHELRTPLTNIRLYVEMLVDGGAAEDPQKRSEALNVIGQEARRLERIVGDMLSVSEIEAGSLKLNRDDVRVGTIFEELAADFREQAAKKEMRLKFDLPPKLPVLRGDRDKIMMAMHNLVANAIKYTPAGGEVTVRVAEEKGNLTVDVIDNGIGIKEEEQELIFEKFYRAKDRRISGVTGTGLGLAITREVVRLHGGEVSVRSQIDKGSTFTMSLPAAA